MDLWFTEKQTENVGITCKAKETLFSAQTEFQQMAVVETLQFGRMLVLDGTVQTTIGDEFVYHEMITHVPLFTHPHPEKVLVIGGGDGGTVREVLKHPTVKSVELVEIDGAVVEIGKKYFPEISCKLEDERVRIIIDDGIKYVAEKENEYDVILIDSPDPVGPAVGLFATEFYQNIFKALKDDGLFVAQTESPFYNKDLIKRVYASINSIFPITKLYLASIPTYPSGLWSFTMGSKTHHPLNIDEKALPEIETRYYTPECHKGAFALPKLASELLK